MSSTSDVAKQIDNARHDELGGEVEDFGASGRVEPSGESDPGDTGRSSINMAAPAIAGGPPLAVEEQKFLRAFQFGAGQAERVGG
jgi:hypothetical protein